jgi:hypothetical protein
MVEAAGVELGSPHFPQIVICRAFLLILKQLKHFLKSSIHKISSTSSTKIKKFYTKFTPKVKHPSTKNYSAAKISFQKKNVCAPGTPTGVITPGPSECHGLSNSKKV